MAAPAVVNDPELCSLEGGLRRQGWGAGIFSLEEPSRMKIMLLTAVAFLAAAPAYAGCMEDLQAQSQKLQSLSQAAMAKPNPSKSEQCSSGRTLMAETKKSIGLYETCKAQLQISDQQIAVMKQQVSASEAQYAGECN
jgi:exonuclease VII small subunit